MTDVAFWDEVGGAHDGEGSDPETAGGSEWATIKVARELARRGLAVRVYTNGGPPGVWGGVEYASSRGHPVVESRTLVVQRHSPLPQRASFEHLLVALHDAGPAFAQVDVAARLYAGVAEALCVGAWQMTLLPRAWRARVVGAVAPELPPPRAKEPGRYVYPAAYAGRGLADTLRLWGHLRPPGGALVLMVPAYGGLAPDPLPPGVVLADPARRLEEFARAEGVFYVNTQPECLPNLYLAEALGCRMHVLGLHPYGLCGVRDATWSGLPTTDPVRFVGDFVRWSRMPWHLRSAEPRGVAPAFTARIVGDRWIEALGLGGGAMLRSTA